MLPELSESEARARIARVIASELEDGALVNLGIGIPQLVPHYLPTRAARPCACCRAARSSPPS